MKNKMLTVLLSSLLLFSGSVYSDTAYNSVIKIDEEQLQSHSKIAKAWELIKQMPEVEELVAKIEKDGPIEVKAHDKATASFEAMWNGDLRTIFLNPNGRYTVGSLICSIIFEMHNAASNNTLMGYILSVRDGKMDKDTFVEKVERMEHDNAMQTCAILNKGIQRGLFPGDAFWKIYSNFNDYYIQQQLTGHSYWIVGLYDRNNWSKVESEYNGTVPNIKKISEIEKMHILHSLAAKYSHNTPTVVTPAIYNVTPDNVMPGVIYPVTPGYNF